MSLVHSNAADLEEELFNLILSDKITVFDLDYQFRTCFPGMYVAEFRKTRYFPERYRETLRKMREDIDRVKEDSRKAGLLYVYVDYKMPFSGTDASGNEAGH